MDKGFSVPFHRTTLIGDIISTGAPFGPSILFLHGAGKASRARYRALREFLSERGIGSCAFDFSGHGDTGGDLAASSLAQRVEEAKAVIEALRLAQPLCLFGSSMGAYVAVKIAGSYPVDAMALLVPAIYDKAAYRMPFDDLFSAAIRRFDSWKDSDAWDVLATYTGKLLIVAAEHDEVVSAEITRMIFERASRARHRELYIVPGSPHAIGRYLDDHPDERRTVFEKVADIFSGRA